MLRSITTALLCGLAVLFFDVLFRTSLLSHIRPVLLSPGENMVADGDVKVLWEGPLEMEIVLARVGGESRTLGVHTSPATIEIAEFERPGGYRIELQHPRFGSWVGSSRLIQHHGRDNEAPSAEQVLEDPAAARYFALALEAARQSRDKSRTRARELRRENDLLKRDASRLQGKIEELYDVQDTDASNAEDLESRLDDLVSGMRSLAAENDALRARLASVIPCTAWGFFTYPRPQTIPRTRRIVAVSNTRGDIFRDQLACEEFRREDSGAASPCFCVGNSFGQ